jgi:hypothetical protein
MGSKEEIENIVLKYNTEKCSIGEIEISHLPYQITEAIDHRPVHSESGICAALFSGWYNDQG